MAYEDFRRQSLIDEANRQLAEHPEIEVGSPKYNAIVANFVERESTNPERPQPYGIQTAATAVAEAPSSAMENAPDWLKTVLGNQAAGASGAIGTVADVLTRGVPKRVGQALDALGINTDLVKRTQEADRYAESEAAGRKEEYPLYSTLGEVAPDLAVSALAPETRAANPYRILSPIEKVGDALRASAQGWGAGAASEAVRSGRADETPEEMIDRVGSGALWGVGGTLAGRGLSGTANWFGNVKNKMPRDLAIEDFKYAKSPEAAALSHTPGKNFRDLRDKAQEEITDRMRTNSANFEATREAGKTGYPLPPSNVGAPRALAEARATPRGSAGFDAQNIPSEDVRRTLESILRSSDDTYSGRVGTIQDLRAKAADMKANNQSEYRTYENMARDLDKELDEVVGASNDNRLQGLHYLHRGDQADYKESMGGLLPGSGTAISELSAKGFPEEMTWDLLGSTKYGDAKRTAAEIIPQLKPHLDAEYFSRLGKEPLGNSSAAEFSLGSGPLGGELDQATEAFLERIGRDDSPSGALKNIINRIPGISIDKSDLANASDSVIKYGKKPAQMSKGNYLADALRAVVGAEIGRYQRTQEQDLLERTPRR